MSDPANVRSLDALRNLRVALLRFENEARRSSSALIVEAQRVLHWLQLEQPQYWKRQVEIAYQQLAEARSGLMKCRMRRTGDFKPTCYDEQKAVERCKRRLELSRKMVEVIKSWTSKSAHEFDEYASRSAQLSRLLDGDIPRAVTLLERMVGSLEKYSELQSPAFLDDLYATAADEDPENTEASQTPQDSTDESIDESVESAGPAESDPPTESDPELTNETIESTVTKRQQNTSGDSNVTAPDAQISNKETES